MNSSLIKRYRYPLAGVAVLAVALFAWLPGYLDRNAEVDFNRDIRPILNDRCVVCHGGVKRKADLSLQFRDDALAPAESGKRAIVPGDPDASELMVRITHPDSGERMPKEDHALSDEHITKLRQWIAQGAEWENHWAYIPPEAPPLPEISDPNWPQNPIDHFILARLDRDGVAPSPQADCPTLVRRVSLDLTGLPSTPSEVDAVCSDFTPDAYEEAVDRLLASPRYGERWAAMWLDLARYADSQGYEKDMPRTIWRYRDWVIDAFNRDMPYDQFTIEQLAGDMLPDATEEQRIATAFSRNSMTNTEGGTDDEEFRVAAVMDRVNTTWEIWQGTSFGCVQCHGHPYDPFVQEDYYRFFAFFNNTADRDEIDERPNLLKFSEETQEEGQALLGEIEAVNQQLMEAVSTPEIVQDRRDWETQLDDPTVTGSIPGTWQNKVLRIAAKPETERDGAERAYIDYVYATIHPDLEELREKRRELTGALRELEAIPTPVMEELPDNQRRRTYIFERGNFLLPTREVQPDVPASMPPMPEDYPKNRLGMAQWLVDGANPLTARVTVNRFWEQLFGLGIVETLEDFGTQGIEPTHPELLDWLAVAFMQEHRWSVKSLLKQMVMSATYRQRSHVTPGHQERDPRNLLLARGPRFRLSAEQIRDQALAVSGLLSEKMYGPSVYPYQPPGIWQAPYSNIDWEMNEGEDRLRRGVYTYWRRSSPYPSMITFDSPSREFCVSRRIRTNTPLQALVTLNDPVYVEAAQALAGRMIEESEDELSVDPSALIEARLKTGYRLALGREPTPEKLGVLRDLYTDAMNHYQAAPVDAVAMAGGADLDSPERAALAVVANVILNLDEFITKE